MFKSLGLATAIVLTAGDLLLTQKRVPAAMRTKTIITQSILTLGINPSLLLSPEPVSKPRAKSVI